jgi:uncharacterized protein with GYD domain
MKAHFCAEYSPEGLKGLMQMGGTGRKEAIEKLCSAMGMQVIDVVFTRGEYDVVVTVEAPDETTVLGALVAIKSTGGFTKATALTEIDMDEITSHSKKANSSYNAPNS